MPPASPIAVLVKYPGNLRAAADLHLPIRTLAHPRVRLQGWGKATFRFSKSLTTSSDEPLHFFSPRLFFQRRFRLLPARHEEAIGGHHARQPRGVARLVLPGVSYGTLFPSRTTETKLDRIDNLTGLSARLLRYHPAVLAASANGDRLAKQK
jgi:hypothetical protein